VRRVLALSTVLLAACASAAGPTASTFESLAACLESPSIGVLPASPTTQFLRNTFPDGHTFDARAHVNTLYPIFEYPVDVGSISGGRNACFVGGIFVGQQPRGLTWEAVKAVGGAAVRLQQAGGADVNGLQVDNLHDGINLRSNVTSDPASGDGWAFRNSYMTYIRDDCIENDDLSSGLIRDVLWDGCFVGVSADRDDSQPDQSSERIVLDHAVIRLQLMPSAEYGMDHGDLLKWSSYAPRPVIRNSVFYVEDDSAGEWPPGTVIQDSTLVWNGDGELSLNSMPGLTITTNTGVWEAARQDWLHRHGCTSFGNCDRLLNPIPPAGSSPRCRRFDATMVGTEEGDKLGGTARRDVVVGLAGGDRILGKGGRDIMCGGGGNDIVRGHARNDRLFGQAGRDVLNGGGGFDICVGGPGRDRGSACEVDT
jgi:RTX calcium-binding nonapeptide repeat (4 copies)